MKKTEKIKLGQKVKDKVTGFVGIAVAKCRYLNGCVQYHISPSIDKDTNLLQRNIWVDEIQLEIIDNGILPELEEFKSENGIGGEPRQGGVRFHPNK